MDTSLVRCLLFLLSSVLCSKAAFQDEYLYSREAVDKLVNSPFYSKLLSMNYLMTTPPKEDQMMSYDSSTTDKTSGIDTDTLNLLCTMKKISFEVCKSIPDYIKKQMYNQEEQGFDGITTEDDTDELVKKDKVRLSPTGWKRKRRSQYGNERFALMKRYPGRCNGRISCPDVGRKFKRREQFNPTGW